MLMGVTAPGQPGGHKGRPGGGVDAQWHWLCDKVTPFPAPPKYGSCHSWMPQGMFERSVLLLEPSSSLTLELQNVSLSHLRWMQRDRA